LLGIEVAKTMTVTALALKRYQLVHDAYPADLNKLVPQFLPAVPLDPVDGQPLRYHLNSDGTFLLYSIGEDGNDDGGDPTPVTPTKNFNWWQKGRDWVWPTPATRTEIEIYQNDLLNRRN
jgi:hypothetical protein